MAGTETFRNKVVAEGDILHIELGSKVVDALNSQPPGAKLKPGEPVKLPQKKAAK